MAQMAKQPSRKFTPYKASSMPMLWFLYVSYIILLFWVVIFKTGVSLPPVRASRTLNLIPFYNGGAEIARLPIFDSIANIVVLIPFGIYLKKFHIGNIASILCGFFTSLFFEATQYVFAIGVSDITDLMTNTAGTALGVLIYLFAVRLGKDHPHLDKLLKITAFVCTCIALSVFSVLVIGNLVL